MKIKLNLNHYSLTILFKTILRGNFSASQVHNSDRSVTELFFNASKSISPPKNSR